MVSDVAADLGAGDAPSSPTTPCRRRARRERGQLLRALASDAIRGGLERHFGVKLAFQNCHRVAAFRPAAVGGERYRRVRLAARPAAQPVAGAARLLGLLGGRASCRVRPAGRAAVVTGRPGTVTGVRFSTLTTLDCPRCDRTHDPDRVTGVCDCGSPLLARYDLDEVRAG